jgi:putative NADH-flavin reductase
MKNKITIAVIGGTGKSGKYLVKQLIKQGFQLKILLRNPNNFQINDPLVEVVKGDVTNYSSIHTLLKGCQAVISTLGLGVPASEPTIFSQATTNVIQAMNEYNVLRYIVTTGINVDTPYDKKSPKTAFATDWMRKNYPTSTANKQSEYDILSNSNVNWTLVRLPLIEQTDESGQIIVSLEDCLGNKISATDLADFLIEQLSTATFVKKSPFIASV